MVWRDTERMGMGQATCPDGAVIIVANYDPPGNVIGRYPY
jgi:pathogenesis-related protein 1